MLLVVDRVPLAALYRLVPATEEEDLLQELAEERRRPHEELNGSELYWPLGPGAVADLQRPDETHTAERPPDTLTTWQALGLVLHVLGGSVLRDP